MRRCTQHRGTFYSNTPKKCEEAITVGRFSQDGSHLALGDKFGRIVLFSNDDQSHLDYCCEVKAYSQGHDWANKETIQPSVKCLEWIENQGGRKGLVTAGDRQIHLWKVFESQERQLSPSRGLVPSYEETNGITTRVIASKCLPGLHTSSIKGLSVSSNQEYLLSFDSNRILRWNLQISNQPHLIYTGSHFNNTFKPRLQTTPVDGQTAMLDETTEEELTEFEENEWLDVQLLTAAKFQPGADNRLAFSTKNGDINYVDMRATNQTKPCIVMAPPAPDHFLKRYLNSVSDFCFLDQHTIAARDFLHVKVWDLRNPLTPKSKHTVFPSVTSQLCELYENGRLTDKFSLAANPSGTKLLTPHFDCSFHEINLATNENIRYRVDSATSSSWRQVRGAGEVPQLDLQPRTESACYNPITEDVCVTIQNGLFLFTAEQSVSD